ncbi:MAG: hypothetical protein LKM39_08775 [Chiayiivirga sp.]|nr:hypothetical protein [Chiayiivirga sp.]
MYQQVRPRPQQAARSHDERRRSGPAQGQLVTELPAILGGFPPETQGKPEARSDAGLRPQRVPRLSKGGGTITIRQIFAKADIGASSGIFNEHD